ncbi:hypothetical protein ACOSP7_020541 [Xanthoceras sorbifolium]|uniref:peroxidase n=1 Tax=Xanthoceras sorbifolium TaxID=99658 RepID=A0ABQ8HLR9_9ROSI|nr:hypothetical protein JRO89_XS09G0164700 [Xanthoceras sorbifolium]
MLFSIFEATNVRKLSFLVFLLCILISFKDQNADTKRDLKAPEWSSSSSSSPSSSSPRDWSPLMLASRAVFLSVEEEDGEEAYRTLEYDFYRDSCPQAESIVRAVIRYLYRVRSDVAPALLRLVFHDCFIEGCDASVLLDAFEGTDSEKDSPPNESLKGFDLIDIIKEELEQVCPGVVSCADILVLAAREGVVQAGGPFYPLFTGRRDSMVSFSDTATNELPSPQADLSETLASFASRGFDSRETVSLLGAHSIGVIHCKFFRNRLYDFGRTNQPDPSLDSDFLNLMRSKCSNISSTSSAPSPSVVGAPSSSTSTAPSSHFDGSPSSSSLTSSYLHSFEDTLSSAVEEQGVDMAYDGPEVGFGTVYYRSLLQGKGILYADQQLMTGEETGIWVRAYASDATMFRRDFALAMMKLSNLRALTAPMGQIRLNCSKVA